MRVRISSTVHRSADTAQRRYHRGVGITVPPHDDALEGHWLWLRAQGEAVHYRVLHWEACRIRQGSGDISGRDFGDPTSLSDSDETRPTPAEAQEACRARMACWYRDDWVLAMSSERARSWTRRRVDHHLLGIELPACSPELVSEIRRHRGITRGRAWQEERSAALRIAIETGRSEDVRQLIAEGAGACTQPYHLEAAIRRGDTDVVDMLLRAGVRVSHGGVDGGPLHTACRFGRLDIATLLLDHGVLVDTPGVKLRTPLHEAVAAEAIDIVELLVARGCAPGSADARGDTPIELAARQGNERIVERLRDRVSDEQRQRAEHLLPAGRERVERRANLHPYTSALLWAAYRGFIDDIRRLLDDEQVPVDSPAPDGRTALFMAELAGRDEVAALLRSRGATEP